MHLCTIYLVWKQFAIQTVVTVVLKGSLIILNYLLASLVSQKLNITLLDIFGFNYLLMLGVPLILLQKNFTFKYKTKCNFEIEIVFYLLSLWCYTIQISCLVCKISVIKSIYNTLAFFH